MLLSLAILFLTGMILGKAFQMIKLPSLIGYLITGIVLGPYVLNLIDVNILNISAELRKIALIIILTRAGLNLDLDSLKKVGRPAILMCFVPACFEIVGMIVFAPIFLGLSLLESAILGTVIAAVSPAVIVPKMLNLVETGYGAKEGIPQMIMAGASVDDIFVIVIFTALTGLAQKGTLEISSLLTIPSSIILGLIGGLLVGLAMCIFFKKTNIRDTQKVIIVLCISFLLCAFEDSLSGVIGFSALLAVMALGATLKVKVPEISEKLSQKFSKLWVGAEVLLFVLVAATVNISYAAKAGISAVILIFSVLIFRIVGVLCCLIKTKLNKKERIFTAMAYTPKATVQAAIGGLPLAMGLACGETVLTVAVVSILLTAPIGAALIDASYKKLLKK